MGYKQEYDSLEKERQRAMDKIIEIEDPKLIKEWVRYLLYVMNQQKRRLPWWKRVFDL